MFAKWDITNKCNLRCTHCSVADLYFNSADKPRQLKQKERLAVVDTLKEGGVTDLFLLGGEPLTLRHQLLELLDYTRASEIRLSIVTNGQLLDARTSKALIDGHLERIVVSVEAPVAEIHNKIRGKKTFERLTENLKTFLAMRGAAEKPKVVVNTVLSRANRHVFADMIPFCLNLGVDEWSALALNHVGNALDNLDNMSLTEAEHTDVAIEIAHQLKELGIDENDKRLVVSNQIIYSCVWEMIQKQHGLWLPQPEICCTASSGLAYISPSGDSYVCDRVHSNEYVGSTIIDEKFQPINLLETSFTQAWNSPQFVEMFEFAKRAETYKDYEPCNHCKYLYNGVCNPCPLVVTQGQKLRFEECLRAERFLGDISSDSEGARTRWEEQHLFEKCDVPHVAAEAFRDIGPKRFRMVEGVRHARQKDGSVLIMHPLSARPIKINSVSWSILQDLDTDRTPNEIVSEFLELFKESAEIGGRTVNDQQVSAMAGEYEAFIFYMMDIGLIGEYCTDPELVELG